MHRVYARPLWIARLASLLCAYHIVFQHDYAPCVTAQLLDQQVVSVTRFDSCLQSPLGTRPAQNVTGQDPGDQLDNDSPPVDACAGGAVSSVIALGLRIQPRAIQGGQTFSFNIGGLGVQDVSTTDGDDVPVCQGTRNGQDCQVLSNEIRISVASTELFAAYDLLPTAGDIPYAYENRYAVVDDDDLNDILCSNDEECPNGGYSLPLIGRSYVVSRQCSGVDSIEDVFALRDNVAGLSVGSIGQSGEAVCPAAAASTDRSDPNYYYISRGASPLVPDSGVCDLSVFGPTSGDDDDIGYIAETLTFGPKCSVFNVDPRAKAAMHLEIRVETNAGVQKLRLGTEQFGAIKGIPNVMFAQINGVNSPTGLVGPYMPGQYVVCNSCEIDDTTCVPGFIDDLAGGPSALKPTPTGGIKTLYNPYRDYDLSMTQSDASKRCPIASHRCRQQFGGAPANAFAYFVPDHRVIENAEMCNSNRVGANVYENRDYRNYVSATLAQCTADNTPNTDLDNVQVCSAFNACLPGYEQPLPNPEAIFNRNLVPTPCQVSRSYAESLAALDPDSTTNVFSHTELDRNFVTPNYFHRNQRVYRDAYGGSTASLSLTLYVLADDVTSVVSISPGLFASSGLSCGGTNAGAGAVGFRVLNRGGTPGTYVVDVGFFIPSQEAGSLDVTTNSVAEIDKQGSLASADLVVRVSQLTAAPGEFADGIVQYTYAGKLGDSVRARLVLRAETASNTQKLDEAEVTCVNIQGVTELTAQLNADDPFNDADAGLQCYWWKWWGGCFRTFSLWTILAIILTLGLSVVLTVTACCCCCNYYTAIDKYSRAVKIAKQGVSARATSYTM